jgi:hypothetical protein
MAENRPKSIDWFSVAVRHRLDQESAFNVAINPRIAALAGCRGPAAGSGFGEGTSWLRKAIDE